MTDEDKKEFYACVKSEGLHILPQHYTNDLLRFYLKVFKNGFDAGCKAFAKRPPVEESKSFWNEVEIQYCSVDDSYYWRLSDGPDEIVGQGICDTLEECFEGIVKQRIFLNESGTTND